MCIQLLQRPPCFVNKHYLVVNPSGVELVYNEAGIKTTRSYNVQLPCLLSRSHWLVLRP